jgi:hypothetical protein
VSDRTVGDRDKSKRDGAGSHIECIESRLQDMMTYLSIKYAETVSGNSVCATNKANSVIMSHRA